jgi:hypothetical protein
MVALTRQRDALVLVFAILLVALGGCSESYVAGADGGVVVSSDLSTSSDGAYVPGPINPDRPKCPGQEATIKGTVYAPNGSDPVPGATVFIPSLVPELFPPEVRCEVCGQLGTAANFWQTNSAYDGTFELPDVCPGKRDLIFQNGRFRRFVTVDVVAKQTLELTGAQTRLPKRHAESNAFDAIPKIAVATGDFDKMECVLRKLGLADDAFDMYEAVLTPNMVSPLNYPKFSELVGNLDKLKSYNVVFINCTLNTFEAELAKEDVRKNIASYLEAGGRLYVTDWSYDWIEQLDSYAGLIDFEPGKSDAVPEGINAAQIGSDGLSVQATIKDSLMAQWLGLFPGAIANGKSTISHTSASWVMMHDVNSDVKVWVEAEGSSSDGTITGMRPLTVTYNVNKCGKLLFTSYHTEGREDDFFVPTFPDYCGENASPQDRILEFLIFDIANCVKVI